MIKLRYDAETGLVGKGYPSTMEIPEPYKLITEEQHDQITTDTAHIYYVKNGQFATEDRQTYERKIRIAKLKMTPLDFIKCLESVGITYAQVKVLCDANEQVDKELRFCQNVYRGNALLDQLCGQFGVTPEQLDALFEQYGN